MHETDEVAEALLVVCGFPFFANELQVAQTHKDESPLKTLLFD